MIRVRRTNDSIGLHWDTCLEAWLFFAIHHFKEQLYLLALQFIFLLRTLSTHLSLYRTVSVV